ncbi:MAG TPA: hypothetical protein VKE74_03270, partial [Gemmataceae bacterium]|nr:hypothetical protein [Gemmataceae bacterium]
KKLKQLTALRAALKPFWDADRPQTGDEYTDEYGGSAWRKPVAPTRDDMGIVIPRRLYRPLPGKDPTTAYDWDPSAGAVAKLAAKATKLLEDGFPGAALKLGKDLWAYPRHHAISYELLDAAYEALGRPHLRQLLAEAKAYREHCDRLRK